MHQAYLDYVGKSYQYLANLADERKRFFRKEIGEKVRKNDKKLVNAINYVLLPKGHFWRPLMVLTTARGYGIEPSIAMPYAVSVEIGHRVTTLLDDLPSMDNSPMRRGMSSCHVKYGIAKAELCSFLLNNLVYPLVINGNASYKKNKAIVNELGLRTTFLLAFGQEKDLDEKNPDLDELIKIYSLKTGSLFSSSAVIGGILGDASPTQLKYLRNFGTYAGIAFQIKDDLHDKLSGQDTQKTIIDIVGIRGGKNKVNEYKSKALHQLDKVKKSRRKTTNFSRLEELIEEMLRID